MNEILNNKIKNCYDITSKVITKYNELYIIMTEFAYEFIDLYEYFIDDLKILILEEHNIYNKLTLNDINICLELLNNIDYEDSLIGSRFERKIKVLKDTYTSVKITDKDLKLNLISNTIEFNLFNSLISLIDIEMMKRLRTKIDSINPDNYNDIKFLKLLYKKYNKTLFMQSFENNLTEIICLSYKMNITKIPNININNLINIIANNFNIDNDINFKPVNLTLSKLAEIAIDRLIYIGFENTADIIFDNMALITRLEIIIELMDKFNLEDLLIYCEMSTDKNNFNINKIKNIIRKKLKN